MSRQSARRRRGRGGLHGEASTASTVRYRTIPAGTECQKSEASSKKRVKQGSRLYCKLLCKAEEKSQGLVPRRVMSSGAIPKSGFERASPLASRDLRETPSFAANTTTFLVHAYPTAATEADFSPLQLPPLLFASLRYLCHRLAFAPAAGLTPRPSMIKGPP